MGRAGGYGGGLADLVAVPFADAMLAPVPTGADPVDHSDADPTRCHVAAAYGGHVLEAPEKAVTGGDDVVVVADPSRDAWDLALRSAAPGGVLTSTVPTLGGPALLDAADLYHRGIAWVMVERCDPRRRCTVLMQLLGHVRRECGDGVTSRTRIGEVRTSENAG